MNGLEKFSNSIKNFFSQWTAMSKINSIFFIILSISTSPTFCQIQPNSLISVTNGEGFVAHLRPQKSFGNINSCLVTFSDVSNIIDLKSDIEKPIRTARNEIIKRYSKGVCGVRVYNVSWPTEGTWKLTVTNKAGEELTGEIKVHILDEAKKTITIEKELEPGYSTLECGDIAYQRYCLMYNKDDHFVNQCKVHRLFLEPSTWYCSILTFGSIEQSLETIKVKIVEERIKYAVATYEENKDYFTMQCQLGGRNRVHSCIAIYPDKNKQLHIREGLNNQRFSALNTSQEERRCVLEIRKPIKNEERGIWRFYVDGTNTGCLFYLGKKKDLIKKELANNYGIKTIEIIEAGDDNVGLIDELECSAPFTLNFCYLLDPLGEIYFVDPFKFEYSRPMGICKFPRLPQIAGIWKCGMSGLDYDEEITQEFEVIIKSKLGEPLTDNIRAAEGDSINLLCRSPLSQAIQHCAFISPQGKAHLMSKNMKVNKNARIKYFGQGFEKGHCGIKIENVEKGDYGSWRCNFARPGVSSSFKIAVNEPPISEATVIGLTVGIVILGVLVVLGGATFFVRRRRARRNAQADDTSISSRE